MGRASDAPVVASTGTQAEPRTPASWLLFADRSQTAAPLPVGSDPRSVRRTEPFHKAPLPSSPALGRYAKGLPCCRNFTPAQPDRPAASMRDFCSGAYTSLAKRTGGTRHAGCETLRFGPQRRYGMLRIFYHPQFTQDYDQVLAQAPHALARYRYRCFVVPRDHHGQAVVVSDCLEVCRPCEVPLIPPRRVRRPL